MEKMTTQMKEEEEREKYEAEYLTWVELAAKEIAATLRKLSTDKINEIIESYQTSLNRPASMHQPLDSEEEKVVERLIGKDRLKNIILLKNSALIFAPSILAPSVSLLDYGTAMHRRFLLHDMWLSIIAINEAYLNSATELMLTYTLEHELAQGELFKELAYRQVKDLDVAIKGIVHEEARMKAIQRTAISADEVEQERQLILKLTTECPVVPVHFASVSLFSYLEENWEEIKQFGLASQNETGKEQKISAKKFTDWIDFSYTSFETFIKVIKREITMTGAEYGVEIV
jgi:hypothetical protein